MKTNEHNNRQNNEENNVSFSFPLSDLLYTQYRKRLNSARNKQEADPEAELDSSGILIVSDELSEGKYAIKSSSFGSVNNIINTLTHVLINKLKESITPEREAREQILMDYMSFFIEETKAAFFSDNDKETE